MFISLLDPAPRYPPHLNKQKWTVRYWSSQAKPLMTTITGITRTRATLSWQISSQMSKFDAASFPFPRIEPEPFFFFGVSAKNNEKNRKGWKVCARIQSRRAVHAFPEWWRNADVCTNSHYELDNPMGRRALSAWLFTPTCWKRKHKRSRLLGAFLCNNQALSSRPVFPEECVHVCAHDLHLGLSSQLLP